MDNDQKWLLYVYSQGNPYATEIPCDSRAAARQAWRDYLEDHKGVKIDEAGILPPGVRAGNSGEIELVKRHR